MTRLTYFISQIKLQLIFFGISWLIKPNSKHRFGRKKKSTRGKFEWVGRVTGNKRNFFLGLTMWLVPVNAFYLPNQPNLVEAVFIFVSSWQCRFNSSIIAIINLNWQKYSLPSMYTSYNCMSFTGDLYSTN